MNGRRSVMLALFAMAEASVIEPLLLLLPSPLRLVDSGVALGITWLLLCAIGFTRRALALREASALLQRGVLGAWLVGLLIASVIIVNMVQQLDPRSLSVLFIEFAAVALIWWRGIALGVTGFGPDSARMHLQIGLLLFVLFALATVLNPQNNLLIFILPFLFGALFALPLSHLERVEESAFGRQVKMDARWWSSLGLGVSIPLFASIAVAALITGDAIGAGLRLLLTVLLIPIMAISFVVAYLLSLLIALLFNQARRNPLDMLQGLGNFLNQLRSRPETNTDNVFTIPPDVRFVIGLLVLVAIIGVLLWLTGRARREAAALRTANNLLDLGIAGGPPPPADESGLFRSFSLRRWLAVLTIRRIYARMSHEAGKRGCLRLPAETPNDYLPRLLDAFPTANAEVRIITEAYIAAHYGEVPDTDEALAQIRSAWERVRATPRIAAASS